MEPLPFDHVVLGMTVDAVLRAEEGGKPEFFRPSEHVDSVFEQAVDRCGVRRKPDASSL